MPDQVILESGMMRGQTLYFSPIDLTAVFFMASFSGSPRWLRSSPLAKRHNSQKPRFRKRLDEKKPRMPAVVGAIYPSPVRVNPNKVTDGPVASWAMRGRVYI